ncbi:MAG: hypothetical protein LBD22_02180 [Spirochaetaceae bacterium]|jgi:hypothetical protein|nr:hypothetical protein [Spirochaetaceae bacterium]
MRNGNTPGRTGGRRRRGGRSKGAQECADYLADARQRGGGGQGSHNGKAKKQQIVRPRWSPPPLLTTPIPVPLCPLCNKPIKDLASAITDSSSGLAAHFDCVRGRIADSEQLNEGDNIAYIGGGRFGVIHHENNDYRHFTIKKIIEFEHLESRQVWRDDIANHFSLT